MIKSFASILAVYVLILTILPCIDIHSDKHIGETEYLQKAAADTHEPVDLCSPFCTCNCCATPAISSYHYCDLSKLSISEQDYSEYKPVYISILYSSIWQPPKLS